MTKKKQAGSPDEISIEVRPARRGELRAIRELVAAYPNQLMQDDLPGLRSFFVALVDGRIIGCCALHIYSCRLAEVRSLAVHPDFLRRGVARRLVERCQQRARQRHVKQVLAVTSELAFFSVMGFSTFLREKNALFFDVPRRQ